MADKSRRRMSEQERDQRRRADRERLQHAAEGLLSSEGWARWVRVRAKLPLVFGRELHAPGLAVPRARDRA